MNRSNANGKSCCKYTKKKRHPAPTHFFSKKITEKNNSCTLKPFQPRYCGKSFKREMELSKESAKRIQRDNQLVDEALNHGDQRAYTALMESHKDSLYYMIFKW